MMRTNLYRVLALAGLAATAACDQVAVDPVTEELSADQALELAVLADQSTNDFVLEMTAASNDVAADFGRPGFHEGRAFSMEAQMHFAAAVEAARSGDRRRALEEGRTARRLLARAILASGGGEAIVALLDRIDAFVNTVGADDDDVFDDPEALRQELQNIVAAARELLARGDSIGAGERALLGEQHARHRRGRRDHRGDVDPDRARVAVELAGTAVSLADSLVADWPVPVRDDLTDVEVTDHRNRWLAHAQKLLALSEEALANGRFAAAVHLAEDARWSALAAVILPAGVTEGEVQAMADLAHAFYDAAEAALGSSPTELQQRLLNRASRLIEHGEELLADGNLRAAAPFWRAAVISRWLLD